MTVWTRMSIALALFFAAVAVAANDNVKPSLWVENDSIDLGRVIAGRTASATYVFHNDGPAEVRILRATPT